MPQWPQRTVGAAVHEGVKAMTSLVDSVVYRDGKRIGDAPIADIGEAMRQASTMLYIPGA